MLLEGKVYKDGSYWLIEVPFLDLMTQGKTKTEACDMLQDALRELLGKKSFKTKLYYSDKESFLLQTNYEELILALGLKRQRIKHHMTLKDVTKNLKAKSINSYAQYEQGKSVPSLAKLESFLKAINKNLGLAFKIVEF